MKRVVAALLAAFLLIPGICFADYAYPKYETANKNTAEITERVNIVFDNTGHEDVKQMMMRVLETAVIAENSAIWIYPIAGSVEPVKVEPTKDFVETNFNTYSKSSNELKEENMVARAYADLESDGSVTTKRLILYANYKTEELRPEYDLYTGMSNYIKSNKNIIFSSFYSTGSMAEENYFDYQLRQLGNIEGLSDKTLYSFFLVKNGYSACESVYDKEKGILKIEKGKADNNIIVFANNNSVDNMVSRLGDKFAGPAPLYIGGCMMGTAAYEDYQKKSTVKGVALSYNHIAAETYSSDVDFSMAAFTADGVTVNPAADDMYIPVVNANKIEVYHRSKKGAGVCGVETSYNAGQDRTIANVYAPIIEETEEKTPTKNKNTSTLSSKLNSTKEESTPKKILSAVLNVIGTIFRLLFALLRLAIIVFLALFIFYRKFRSYIQLKILNTKFGPTYENLVKKVMKIIRDISGAGAKIRGTTDLKGEYIFISKASADMAVPNNRVELVVKELESRGVKCWLSETGIKPGQDYNVVLPEAIKNCTLFLLFVSPMSVRSSDVVSEIGTAKEHKKTIIPVQIEPFDLFKDFPNWAYMLKQYQKTDLFKSTQEDIKALADHIQNTLNDLK